MSYDGLVCTSCGSKQIINANGLFTCTYCNARVVPRLIPGNLCNDLENGAFCSKPAGSICTACGRPLCELHNNRKMIYWQVAFDWRTCCPEWDDSAGRAWGIVSTPITLLPVPGYEPFQWVDYEKDILYRIGEIEREVIDAVKTVVEPAGGDQCDTNVIFPCICGICEGEIFSEVSKAIGPYREKYRQVAYLDRLKAIGACLRQGISYVEAFLTSSISEIEYHGEPVKSLNSDSIRSDWDRCGADLKRRFSASHKLWNLLDSARSSARAE